MKNPNYKIIIPKGVRIPYRLLPYPTGMRVCSVGLKIGFKMDVMLKALIELVTTGGSRRFSCPICGGKNTLSVSNINGKVKYVCFKLSCGLRGVDNSYVTPEDVKDRLRHSARKLNGVKFVIPDYFVMGLANNRMVSMLQEYHCLEAYQADKFKCAYDPKEDRFVVFINNEDKTIIGAVGRRMGKTGVKVKNYMGDTSHPFIVHGGDTLVLVEDVFSAISVTRNTKYSGMALLGTNMKEAYLSYIKGYQHIIVALDADAKNKALGIKNLLTYYHPSVSVRFLKEDIKYMETI